MDKDKETKAPGADFFEGGFNFWKEFLSRAASLSDFSRMPFNDMVKGLMGTNADLFADYRTSGLSERVATALKFYSSLLNWWMELLFRQFSGPEKQTGEAGSPFPDGFLKTMESYTVSFARWADMFARFIQEAGAPADEAGDRMTRHIDALLRIYEDGLGRFIKMPSIGPSQYSLERGKEWIDSAIKYQMVLVEYYQNLLHPLLEVSAGILEKARAMMKQGPTEEMIEELYALLLEEGEKAYFRYFQSGPYLESMKMALNAHLEMQETGNAMMIEMLKGTPVVTRPDIEEVYRDLYLLKKKVREMEKKLSRLEGQEDR